MVISKVRRLVAPGPIVDGTNVALKAGCADADMGTARTAGSITTKAKRVERERVMGDQAYCTRMRCVRANPLNAIERRRARRKR